MASNLKIHCRWSKIRHDFLKRTKALLAKNRIIHGPLLIQTNRLRKIEKCYFSGFNPKFVTYNKKILKTVKPVFSDETERTYKEFVNLKETGESLMTLLMQQKYLRITSILIPKIYVISKKKLYPKIMMISEKS